MWRKMLGVDYKECLYVGDSEVDVVTGKNAGVKIYRSDVGDFVRKKS